MDAGAEFRVDLRRATERALPPALLASLSRLDAWRGYRAFAQTLGVTILTLVIAIEYWSAWIVIPAILVIATQQHALFVLAHDAAHYRLAPNRRVNDFLGRLVGSLAGISMCSYRVIHRLHHNHLYSMLDPDIALHGGYPRGKAYLLKKIAGDLVGITAWKTYRYFFGAPALDTRTQRAQRPLDDTSPALRAAALNDRRTVIGVQIALPLGILMIFGWTGLLQYALLWILPTATLLQAILRIRAIAEHGAPADFDSPLTAARTNLPGLLARWILFPHHVNYHIEHHLFPAVPHYHLPRLHAELKKAGVLDQAEVRRFSETWQRVYADRGEAGAPAR